MSRERPILYSAPMVLAKLAGRKTQTRRIAKFKFLEGQNPNFSGYSPGTFMTGGTPGTWVLHSRGAGGCWNDRTEPLDCPYGAPGDRLWGRETWRCQRSSESLGQSAIEYAADGAEAIMPGVAAPTPADKWRPSIFMPRWASRLLDEVVSVRVERLQDISEADAIAEGLESHVEDGVTYWGPLNHGHFDPRQAYFSLWDAINGEGAAAKNPWVWRVETRPVTS